MKLTLELKHLSDLEILLPLLRRLDISVMKTSEASAPEKKEKPPLSKHIGALPSMDVTAFDKYLQETRKEWDRPII